MSHKAAVYLVGSPAIIYLPALWVHWYPSVSGWIRDFSFGLNLVDNALTMALLIMQAFDKKWLKPVEIHGCLFEILRAWRLELRRTFLKGLHHRRAFRGRFYPDPSFRHYYFLRFALGSFETIWLHTVRPQEFATPCPITTRDISDWSAR
jgi:hypothetical protein